MNMPEKPAQDDKRITRTLEVKNSLGLHLRPASKLVKLASSYEDCEVMLSKGDQRVNAKSIMGVIMLAAEQGAELIVEVSGEHCVELLDELEALFNRCFDEE